MAPGVEKSSPNIQDDKSTAVKVVCRSSQVEVKRVCGDGTFVVRWTSDARGCLCGPAFRPKGGRDMREGSSGGGEGTKDED